MKYFQLGYGVISSNAEFKSACGSSDTEVLLLSGYDEYSPFTNSYQKCIANFYPKLESDLQRCYSKNNCNDHYFAPTQTCEGKPPLYIES